MILETIQIRRFRNFVDSTTIHVEADVTALVGKNESGKSSVLQALYRLNPANEGYTKQFNQTEEYPRWRLATDRRSNDLAAERPITAVFILEDSDRETLATQLQMVIPPETRCRTWRRYDNVWGVELHLDLPHAIGEAGRLSGAEAADVQDLLEATSIEEARTRVLAASGSLQAEGETARAQTLNGLLVRLTPMAALLGSTHLDQDQVNAVAALIPKFFYFSNYAVLPGNFDLDELLTKPAESLTEGEQTAMALLEFAGVAGTDLQDTNFESRKAELESAAIALTAEVFEYWKQNEDLTVDIDDDLKDLGIDPATGQPNHHRFLDIRLKDQRHGGVSTNFSTRSSGFQWFFSFLAAFSKFELDPSKVVVLLDEPGTSLHGEAQADFLRFIFERLGTKQQVIYTTHSQHMVDTSNYEKIRAVEDRSTRLDPNPGAVVEPISFSTDRQTLLPVQAALGYSINQHLMLGAYRHLVVEGGSDFIYLSEMARHLVGANRTGLDPTLSILPVGGADKIPAFVALLAQHLRVTVLMDGGSNSPHVKRVTPLVTEGILDAGHLVLCSEIANTNASADIEDMFEPDDYLRLVNWAYGSTLTSSDLSTTSARLAKRAEDALGTSLDHLRVAAALTDHRAEFFAGISDSTLGRFEELLIKLNGTVA